MTPSQTQALLREAKQEIASKHNFDTWDEADMIDYNAFPKMIEEVAVEFHTRLLAEARKHLEEYSWVNDEMEKVVLVSDASTLLAAKQEEIEMLKKEKENNGKLYVWELEKVVNLNRKYSELKSQLEAAQLQNRVFEDSLKTNAEIQANYEDEIDKLQAQLKESKAEVERLKDDVLEFAEWRDNIGISKLFSKEQQYKQFLKEKSK